MVTEAAPLQGRVPLGRHVAWAAEALGLVLFLGFCRLLPLDWASATGGFIGRKLGPRLGVTRRALANLRRALSENDEGRNQEIILGMWDNLGRVAAEYAHLPRICAPGSGRVEVVDGHYISALATDGKPGIIFGGHFANWEVGPYMLRHLLGQPLSSVYRAPNNPWADRLVNILRGTPDRVPKGGEGGRDLLRVLKGGGHVGILVDQKLNDGIPVPFFGRDAMTAPAVARFGLRFACPLVPVYAERLDGARFRIVVLPPITLIPSGDTAADVAAAMADINKILEGWVRNRPEQWLWVHRRWPD